jgi:signal peptidase I
MSDSAVPPAPPDSSDPDDSERDLPDSAAQPDQRAPAAERAGTAPQRRSRFGRLRSAGRATQEPKPRSKASKWELPILIAVAICIAIVVKTFLVQPFYIPSESMEKTLHGCTGCSGDRVLVNKPIYHLRDPHPGDIVVFKAPTSWDDEVQYRHDYNPVVGAVRWFGQLLGVVPPDEKDLIKRVIATGGQTVKCCDLQGRVEVSDSGPNGPWTPLNEPYIFNDGGGAPTSTFGPVTVPKGRLWVMGDHRNDSADSRAHCLLPAPAGSPPGCDPVASTIPLSAVIGKAVLIVWPPSRWRTLGTPATFAHDALAAGGSPPLVAAGAIVLPIGLLRRRGRGPRRRPQRGGRRGRDRVRGLRGRLARSRSGPAG